MTVMQKEVDETIERIRKLRGQQSELIERALDEPSD